MFQYTTLPSQIKQFKLFLKIKLSPHLSFIMVLALIMMGL